ncbi:hypothetical protein VE00_05490 [Pseudogymnoascus sp. WSF 3629]|nr:hypothetical protein VE00_05490 [Pseudogymnoascus sp. WSF 3629]
MLSIFQENQGAIAGQLPLVAFMFLTTSLLSSFVISYFRSGLRELPGPVLARFTLLWKVWVHIKGDGHVVYQNIHKRYGPIVRTGPNSVSIGDAAMIPKIYLSRHSYLKSSDLAPFTFMIDGKSVESMFTTRDPVLHKALKSAVASKYSLSSMLQLEPLFDKCMPLFVAEMDKRAGLAIDFGSWCSCLDQGLALFGLRYSFDLTGLLSFQELFGFMEQAKDINGVIESSWSFMSYGTLVGQYPYLHKYLLGNPRLVQFLDSISNANPMRLITETARVAIDKYDEKSTDLRGDFLEYLRQKQLKNPQIMTDRDLINNILIFFVGAVNTNSASLRACFYYLVKTPYTYAKLVKELQDADTKDLLSEPLSFTQGQKLLYLQACIKEALRMYPIVGTPFDRVVPKGGAILSGHFVPEGTVVGISGWATQRDKGAFGEDAESFRPERWLDADEKQIRVMDRSMLAFGQGTRGCVGKHVAIMALTKTVGQIVRVFDMEWAGPREEWELTCLSETLASPLDTVKVDNTGFDNAAPSVEKPPGMPEGPKAGDTTETEASPAAEETLLGNTAAGS